MAQDLADDLEERFGRRVAGADALARAPGLAAMAGRGSCRHFLDEPVPFELIEALAAVALSAPTKSDLQQRDIVVIRDPALKARLLALVADQAWTAGAPELLIFCGNNRRQRQIHEWRGRAFANDHLDAFFNAAVDAGIALSAFVTAAEAAGLGCCPISALRNDAAAVSAMIGLPDHVFPVAGLALGRPKFPPRVTMRLPLDCTLHVDRFEEDGLRGKVDDYDRARAAHRPYGAQRRPDLFGAAADYGWSEDKARQYALPERAGFGAFVRAKGFDLK